MMKLNKRNIHKIIIVIALTILAACFNTTSNQTPTISGTPETSVVENALYQFTPIADDPDGDPLTFSITNKPVWAEFSATTGTLSGTPISSHVGTFSEILISVSDGTNTVSLPQFSIDVTALTSNGLQVDVGDDQTVVLSNTFNLAAVVTEDPQAPNATLTYFWAQDTGPGNISFTDSRALMTTATANEVGSYVLSLTANSDEGTVKDTFNLTVNALAGGISGLTNRPSNTLSDPTNCIAPASPPTSSAIKLETPFPDLPNFSKPVAMFMAPGDSSYWYVVLQEGRIYKFENSPTVNATTTFIDIRSRVTSGGEAGLLGMAFDPDFSNNGYVYLSYTDGPSGSLVSRISRVTLNTAGTGLDDTTEKNILSLDQNANNHNGGQINFGPDGFLYIGFGDGGSSGDPKSFGQDTSTLLGAMLRIDVNVGASETYKIPTDNPFATSTCDQSARSGQCPEIFAYGLRNPWRWTFDRNTGDLWLGDVGQGSYEEIDIIRNGGNYGWNVMEGMHCYNSSNCDQTGLTLPVAEYGRSVGYSVTGGYVYRGSNITFLFGRYLYADYGSGIIASLEKTDVDEYNASQLLDTNLNISAFAEDHEGELYIINYGGTIHKIMEDPSSQSGTAIPTLLSEWGCFQDGDATSFSDHVVSYDINSLLWSDRANKERFMAIPDNTTIDINSEGQFIFPVGSILGKNFWLDNKLTETRLLLHYEQPTGWKGFSYAWNNAGTDASLLTDSLDKVIDTQTWHYPSSAECDSCHTAIAKFALGPELGQFNRDYVYPDTGTTANQLISLETVGLLTSPLTEEQKSTTYYAIDNAAYSVELRARSYLHTNCAHCHQPDGTGGGSIDLRFSTSLNNTALCNVAPAGDSFGLTTPRLLSPGKPDESILVLRLEDLGDNRMPPLATGIVDNQAMTVIREWISQLSECP